MDIEMAVPAFISLPRKAIDRTGIKFGKLTLLGPVNQHPKNGDIYWLAACECGGQSIASYHSLKSCTGCGCNRAQVGERSLRHGHARGRKGGTPTYSSWIAMRRRCGDPKHHKWEQYGGRGIVVCERWQTFENFLVDMGARPEGMTLDRYPNPNGHYEPGNCRWATPLDQRHNRGR